VGETREREAIHDRKRDMAKYIKMGEEEGITRNYMTIRSIRQFDGLPLWIW
jgi:hypothetical protein